MADRKRRFAGQIVYGDGWTEEGLGQMARREPEKFLARAQEMIEKRELRLADISSLGHLFDALWDVPVKHMAIDARGNRRSITSNAFALLTGGLVAEEVNLGMEATPVIGDQLVTDIQDAKKWSHYAAILVAAPHQAGIAETEPFPEIGASEERYDIGHKRNGFKLSITAEAIEENEIPEITDRCNRLGEIAVETIEEQTLDRVCDRYGSATSPAEPYVLRLNGAGTSLFTVVNTTLTRLSSSGNRVTNNALTDESDLETVRARLATFLNERGKRVDIPASRCVLLVPDALVSTARKIVGSEYVPGVENELNDWGPRGAYRPKLLSSAMLDVISSTAWYYGDFVGQYLRKWKLRFENASLGGEATQMWLDRRIAAQFRIAWDCEIGARGYQRVIQSLSGTVAP